MADDVNIVGIGGLPDWATEDTLRKIQAILQKALGLQKISVKAGAGGLNSTTLKEINRLLQEHNKRLKESNALTEQDNVYKRKGLALYQMLGTRQAAYGTALLAVTQTFNIMKNTMKLNVKTFDELFRAGVMVVDSSSGQNDAFKTLGNIALLTGLRMESFSQVMQNFAGANAVGAVKFAKTIPIISREMTALGFDIKSTAEAVGSYLDTIVSTRDIQEMSSQEIAEGALEFSRNITRLSMATGVSRQKLLQQTTAISSSTDAYAVAAEYGEKAAVKMSQFAASFSDPEIGSEFVKMMSAKLPVLNSTFQNFAKAGLGGLGMQLTNFSKSLVGLDPDEAAIRTRQFFKGLGDLRPVIHQQKLLAEAGVEGAAENLKTLQGIAKQQSLDKKVSEEDFQNQLKAQAASAKLSNQWERITAAVQKLFSPSVNIISMLASGLELLADAVTWAVDKLGKFDNMVASITGSIGVEWKDATATVVALGAAFVAFRGALVAHTAFMQLINAKNRASAATGIAGKAADAAGSAGGITGKAGGGLSGLIGGLGRGLGELLKSVGQGGGKMIQSLMSGLAAGLAAFANPKILVGSAILSGSIAVLAAGLSASAWMLGKTLPTLAEGLNSMTAVDGENLGKVGKGLLLLSSGLALFGAGSVIASSGTVLSSIIGSLGNLAGIDSPFQQMQKFASIGNELQLAGQGISMLAKGLKEFSEIDSTLLSANADSFEKIQNSVKESSPGLVDSIVSMFRGPAATRLETERPSTGLVPGAATTPIATAPTRPAGSGIEQGSKDAGINSILTQQTSLIEQLLTSTKDVLSVNKDILKYTKLQT